MSAILGFAVLHKFGRNLKLPRGCQGLPGLVSQGLPKMISTSPKRLPSSAPIYVLMEPVIVHMLQWYDNCRQLWLACGSRWDDTSIRLSECFFDTLTVSFGMVLKVLYCVLLFLAQFQIVFSSVTGGS